ncbi:type VI secretion system tip protein VgrG [Trinickia dabaoshanensis]|uniref:Type VI secretion system tip protein VgrG n=1 Tax=Trinickia dabaoshanensis TaxID=564714 RepID=A0A2N7VDD4_9BURK|nr:type VI secretion system Vgr family protein [Trinickia dabaoshanensis]PMS15137.1 type VI secretion system tip protein VgrG [Trinickia dabaoshanensis]
MKSNTLFDALYYGAAQRNRLIKLDTPLGADWLVPLQAKGSARLGCDYEFIVDAASIRGNAIKLDALIGQTVTLWLQQTDGSYLPHHGYVHAFSRLGTDGTLTYYQLRFSSWLYFLRLRRDMRDWQEQPGEQIVADVFEQHPQARGAYRFELRQPMPKYSNRVQWEYDWDFVQRSLEETGVFGRFEHAEDGKSHTLVLMDDAFALPQLAPDTITFHRMGLREEAEGLTQWKAQQQIQSAKLTTRTFDYKRPDLPKQIVSLTDASDTVPAQGEVYDYTGAYTWGASEHGAQQASVRTEAWQSQATRYHGIGSVRHASPGYWFTLKGHPVHDRGPEQDRQFVILAATWTIRNNLPGMDGVADFPESLQSELIHVASTSVDGVTVKHPDGSEGFFQVEIEAQPRRTPFRSPLEHRKPVLGLQSGIVAGPNDEEIYTDSLNRVKVWFPWNRRNEGDEGASVWVRSAFPDAGGDRGGHHPLRKGDEVIVGFMEGDCDRPVILSRMHGGPTPPTWHTHGLLSGFRSKEYAGSGFNQLVMDDATGQNRVHLYSTSADSHLHLGYLVDHTNNTRGAYAGTGFDLKSAAHGAIRAEQGLYVSTFAKSQASQPLDVAEAQSQLNNAQSVIQAMSRTSEHHQAESLQDGYDAIRTYTDATRKSVPGAVAGDGRTAGGGTGNANGFDRPVLLFGSPAGIGVSTQQSVHVATTDHVNLVSGQSVHVATGKSMLASIGEKLSLFVQNAGMKLFAANGKVELQAQSDNIELTAQQALKVVSTTDRIEIASDQGILLTSGGAYIKIAGGNIEVHGPGTVDVKGAQRQFAGPASMGYPLPSARPDAPGQLELLHRYANNEAVKNGAFSVFDANGALLKQGSLDGNGHTIVSGLPPGVVKVKFGADPRTQDQEASKFTMPKWPQEDPSGADDAATAAANDQVDSLMPAGGAGKGAAGFASLLGNGSGSGNGNALSSLKGMATDKGLSFAEQAMAKVLPTGAQSALSHAGQIGSALPAVGHLAQSGLGSFAMPKLG